MKKLAIVSTHPIQYNAPWFRLLAERGKVDVKVFYTWSQAAEAVEDKTFGKSIKWDIPLLEGYEHEFIPNTAKRPGVDHFFGIRNPKLIYAIKKFGPDAILVFGWNFISHFSVMRHFHKKIPVWFRGDSTLLNENVGMKTILRRNILKTVYRYVDKALYVGEANKRYFQKHGLKESQLLYAPHAIDNQRFQNEIIEDTNDKYRIWRAEFGYRPEHIVVLFAGKFEAVKQPKILVSAFIKASKNNKNLRLLMVGNGPLEKELMGMSSNKDAILFTPFQNQSMMPNIYSLGNVFCLPSKSETWGLAVNEAMACGLPVIVSNKVGCSEDLVKHGENGYVFNFESQEALENIFKNLELGMLKQMGLNASTTVENFSFKAIVETIESNL